MAIKTRKNEYGEIEVKVVGDPNLVLIRRGVKIVDGFKMNILYFINNQTKSAYWIMDQLQTTILSRTGNPGKGFLHSSEGEGDRKLAVKVRYESPVMMFVNNWRSSSNPQLVDHEMKNLSGSNIHGDGQCGLCLGASVGCIDFNMIDSLILGRANNDLHWRGGRILGSTSMVDNGEGKRTKVFNITSWPTIQRSPAIVPQELIDCLGALKR